jgi:hypothetical protein
MYFLRIYSSLESENLGADYPAILGHQKPSEYIFQNLARLVPVLKYPEAQYLQSVAVAQGKPLRAIIPPIGTFEDVIFCPVVHVPFETENCH